MIIQNNELSTITVLSESKQLSCNFALESQKDFKRIFNIDISNEVEKLINEYEHLGYSTGEYNFSFTNKILSLHHSNIKKEINNNISKIMKRYVYEQNNEDTRLNLKADIINYFNILKSKFAITNYIVICDETNNTKTTIESNQLNLRIAVKFGKEVEPTIIDYSIKSV